MKFPSRALRPDLALTYTVPELGAVALIAAVVSGWAAVAGGSFSLPTLFACEVVFFSFYLVGTVVAAWQPVSKGILFDLPLRLLVGYALVNTTLLVLACVLPFGVIVDFVLLMVPFVLLFFAARERRLVRGAWGGLWVIGLCLFATMLWCQDSISPTEVQGRNVLFKPWVDGFYHAVHIRIFAASHGASTIEDFRLAGVPARLYHYGVYLMPALIKQVSGIHSYAAFAGILAPVGVFFTGLAAYAFVGSLWGTWPGFTAAAALLLLPDGAQQGMHNTFMSYHWLTQISPSATYGLALIGVAWLFVIRGCMQGNRLQLLIGWGVAGVLAFYKLHFVIACALLLLLVPPLFFRAPLGLAKRAVWAVSASAFYLAAIHFVQQIPGVPVIRFDGSCTGEILRLVRSFAAPGALHDYLESHVGPEVAWASNLAIGIPYVTFAALGVFAILLVILTVLVRKRIALLPLLFPLLLVVNFLAMFFGLALDFVRSTPDELSHRPVMIVYFFVLAWIGGVLGLVLFESDRLKRVARPALITLAALLMAVPAVWGSGVQLMPAMPRISPVRISRDIAQIAEYVRDHSGERDVFQDSQFDWIYAFASISERRAYASRTMTRMPFRSEMIDERAQAIDDFMGLREASAVAPKARELGFQWFLLQPGDRVDWPAEVTDNPALKVGPFRLYHF